MVGQNLLVIAKWLICPIITSENINQNPDKRLFTQKRTPQTQFPRPFISPCRVHESVIAPSCIKLIYDRTPPRIIKSPFRLTYL
jgi:hypothetical protein